MGHVLRWSLLAAISSILAPTLAQPLESRYPPQFSTIVRQVEVYASVTDGTGRPVRNLSADDFVVSEDGVVQHISTFAAGEFPAAVAVALDHSVSMAGRPLATAKAGARALFNALRAEDRAMLIGISGEVEVLAPLSLARAPVAAALDAMDAWSTTALHDAVIRAVDLLEPETGRRAIVVLSDGDDRYSTASAVAAVERVRRSDVLIYPIATGRAPSPLFAELAAVSGGRSFHLRDAKTLTSMMQMIADELRWQYLVGYQPAQAWTDRSEWRSVSVALTKPTLRVRARSGYTTR